MSRRPAVLPADAAIRRLRAPLVRWYRRHRRDLPWRRTTDPYAIWVSESMLQQTQVATVVPYYRRFLELFPTLEALAAAAEDEVLAAWSGLGYYRRARALREGARMVVERHGGRVPRDPETLRTLPGVGRYTAGAIASLAFGAEEPVVDGNVRRVLSRLFALEPRGAAGDERLWSIAGALARGSAPGDLNQALMELGATVCTSRSPSCAACPVARDCAARASGDPDRWPAPKSPKPATSARLALAVVVRRGAVLLERRSPGAPLRGEWDLPAALIADGLRAAATLEAALAARLGVRVALGPLAATSRHAILDRRFVLEAHAARSVSGRPAAGRGRFVPLGALDRVPVSSATTKILRALGLTAAPTAASTSLRPAPGGPRRR